MGLWLIITCIFVNYKYTCNSNKKYKFDNYCKLFSQKKLFDYKINQKSEKLIYKIYKN